MRRIFAISVFLLAVIAISTVHIQTEAKSQKPLVGVVKKLDTYTVRVNEPFTIYIEITNFSNTTIYNVTLSEEYPNWNFEILDRGAMFWPKILPNETATTFLKIKVKNYVTPIVDLGYAVVTYYDGNGIKYTAYSEDVKITLLYYESTNIDVKSVWRNISISLGIVLLAIVAPLLALEYRFYKRYKEEAE